MCHVQKPSIIGVLQVPLSRKPSRIWYKDLANINSKLSAIEQHIHRIYTFMNRDRQSKPVFNKRKERLSSKGVYVLLSGVSVRKKVFFSIHTLIQSFSDLNISLPALIEPFEPL